MKEQTYITCIYNEGGRQVNFERWSCKKVATVNKNMKTLFSNDLYKACNREARYYITYDNDKNAVTDKIYVS